MFEVLRWVIFGPTRPPIISSTNEWFVFRRQIVWLCCCNRWYFIVNLGDIYETFLKHVNDKKSWNLLVLSLYLRASKICITLNRHIFLSFLFTSSSFSILLRISRSSSNVGLSFGSTFQQFFIISYLMGKEYKTENEFLN